ncbi:MAG: ComF family protein [Cytophagaceae bacterium]|nr:ComF family protein [Cytophagaceae bacterium]MDW8457009.1 ComF family protein [Cytophagaceae bacterium]
MFRDLLDILFPDCCTGCGNALYKNEQAICLHCLNNLPRTNFHTGRNSILLDRLKGRIPVKYAFSFLYFTKGGIVQNLLHNIKYNQSKQTATLLGNLYGHELLEYGYSKCFDVILPVPIHKNKEKKRGYNQSAIFGEALASVLQIPFSNRILIRTKNSDSQTHKNRIERWINTHNTYAAVEPDEIKNKKILLVDDIITTGATIESCAEELYKNNVLEVSVASIAVAR